MLLGLKEAGYRSIHIMAHSMGVRVLLGAIPRLAEIFTKPLPPGGHRKRGMHEAGHANVAGEDAQVCFPLLCSLLCSLEHCSTAGPLVPATHPGQGICQIIIPEATARARACSRLCALMQPVSVLSALWASVDTALSRSNSPPPDSG